MDDKNIFPAAKPSPQAQAWGAVLSIVIIVLMIIIGAYYSWSKRVASYNSYGAAVIEATGTTTESAQ